MKRALAILILLSVTACGDLSYYTDFPIAQDGDRVVYGDSIPYHCFNGGINRAVPGSGVRDVLDMVKYFDSRDGEAEYTIHVGINDILFGDDTNYLYNMDRILGFLSEKKVKIISILPTAWPVLNGRIGEINNGLRMLAYIRGVEFIDKYDEIKPEHLSDGIHLTDEGCRVLQ